jgi:prolyl oligopeptidase
VPRSLEAHTRSRHPSLHPTYPRARVRHAYEWRSRNPTFYSSKKQLRARRADGSAGSWLSLDGSVPDDASVKQFRDQLLIQLRSAWRGHAAGTLLAARIEQIAWDPSGAPGGLALAQAEGAPLSVLFEPTPTVALSGSARTRGKLVLTLLDTVKTRVLCLSCAADGAWTRDEQAQTEPLIGGISISAVDADAGDDVWLTEWTHLRPHTYKLGSVRGGVRSLDGARTLRALPPQFDASGLRVEQGFATSKDGTQVPYFVIRAERAAAKPAPTLLYGYGGFEISLTPNYMSTVGAAWLEDGGCFVEANIRGGGEFGPDWHRAALKANRNKAYEDFEVRATTCGRIG